jgi:cardiolipin synthase
LKFCKPDRDEKPRRQNLFRLTGSTLLSLPAVMDILNKLVDVSGHIAAVLAILLAILSSGHVVLFKRDSRAAVAWVGFIWLVPLVGSILYFLLGVNRIRRQAVLLRGDLKRVRSSPVEHICTGAYLKKSLPPDLQHLEELERLGGKLFSPSLLSGNAVELLINGDEAYPAMLKAIDQATESISLATYIFDNDSAGLAFVEALQRAVRRGVEVRVLIDDTGARYSWPSIVRKLRKAGIRVERFLPTVVPFHIMAINMRNHRKMMVTDGRVAFTGGMNIRRGHLLANRPKHPVQDMQFRVEGPVVAHVQETFVDDWFFTCREALRGEKWFPSLEAKGPIIARGISDGPDENFERLRLMILGALACARSRVRVFTPYFLPDQALISALNIAAMRGVAIEIVLPESSNLPLVQWATFAQLWQVLDRGCRVWLTPPPFDHTKFMVVDGYWSLIGSTNWDPRSLRLNFEFNLECYDRDLAERLETQADRKLRNARELTLTEVDKRSLFIRLRDGVARLLSPYL